MLPIRQQIFLSRRHPNSTLVSSTQDKTDRTRDTSRLQRQCGGISRHFSIKYEAKDGSQDHLDYHRDSSLLSFTMLLNDPSEFEGGGTKFKGLNDTVLQHEVGMLTIHCGQLLHGGQKITSGKRYIMAGFISASSPHLNADVVLESKTIRANNYDIPDEFYLETLFDKTESTGKYHG